MIEEFVLWGISSVITLLALAMVGWEVTTGRALSLDGLCFSLICLTLAAVFGGNVAWSLFTGEFHRILSQLGKGAAKSEESPQSHPPTA